MEYNEIEDKYIKGHYLFESVSELKKVLGYEFRTTRGFKKLTEVDKQLEDL